MQQVVDQGVDTDGAELLGDRSRSLRGGRIGGGRIGARFRASVPGAIVGTFLLATLAFGAAMGPLGADGPFGGDHAGGGHSGAGREAPAAEPTATTGSDGSSGGVDLTVGWIDGHEPTTAEPTEGPVVSKEPIHEPDAIDIGLALHGAGVVVEWSPCEVDGFVAYKVIRSTDEVATWPLGTGDSVVAVVTDASVGRIVDRAVEAGRAYAYRVVALRAVEGTTVVACRSVAARIKTPAPKPSTDEISLTVVIKEGHPFLDWSECGGLDFDYFKVVRSTDAIVTWPAGENDTLVAAIGRDGNSKLLDAGVPGGKKFWYRVFCVRSSEAGYAVIAASPVRSVTTPVVEPAPDPVALGFDVTVTADGVALDWQAYGGDAFHYYKVVRSSWNEHPSYLPYVDGTEVIGVLETSATTHYVDTAVTSGQTIYYRVQAIGIWNGAKVQLGQTIVIAVIIP